MRDRELTLEILAQIYNSTQTILKRFAIGDALRACFKNCEFLISVTTRYPCCYKSPIR